MEKSVVDQLAEAELNQYKSELLYAERQTLKAGDYEATAASFLRRKRFALSLCLAALGVFFAMAVSYAFNHPAGEDKPFSLVWPVAFALGAGDQYRHAKRTHETILRWKRIAAGEASGDAPEAGPS